VVEAVVPVLAALLAAAEVSTNGSVTSMKASVLSCHKASKSKSHRWQGIHPFLPFSLLLFLAYSLEDRTVLMT
jgi:hypothetical protein